MGRLFADQYSILHFSVGSIMYFWNVSFIFALIVHTLFEYVENTQTGMKLINKYVIHPGWFSWPGGKNESDTLVNNIGDTVFFALGFLISQWLDLVGTNREWYIH
jgi:hypothetical protein